MIIQFPMLDMDHKFNPKLVTLERNHRNQFADFVASFNGEPLENILKGAMDDFDAYIERLKDIAAGRNLPAGWVPGSMYWLIDDGPVLGYLSIRHNLNETLLFRGGHIGYCIHPRYRRRGLGTLICRLGLEKAKALGINPVLITCNRENIASTRIIESNGGVFEDERYEEATGNTFRRYWIAL